MLEQIWELIQPQVIEIITTLLLAFLSYVGVKVKALYESKVKNEQVKEKFKPNQALLSLDIKQLKKLFPSSK